MYPLEGRGQLCLLLPGVEFAIHYTAYRILGSLLTNWYGEECEKM